MTKNRFPGVAPEAGAGRNQRWIMQLRTGIAAAACLLVLGAWLTPAQARESGVQILRIGTGGTGGTYFPIGSLIAQAKRFLFLQGNILRGLFQSNGIDPPELGAAIEGWNDAISELNGVYQLLAGEARLTLEKDGYKLTLKGDGRVQRPYFQRLISAHVLA